MVLDGVNRRALFRRGGLSLASVALGWLLDHDSDARGQTSARPLAPHFPPRAKNVIYLHMIGAPSQLDLFDAKPELVKRDGEPCPESRLKGKRFAFIGGDRMTLAGSSRRFAKHGRSGQEMSDLLPNLATVADELAVIRSMRTDEINHAPAQMLLQTGFGRGGRPSLGSWVAYGLGSENADLPAFVVLRSGPVGGAGASLWSSGFLPSDYQGVPFRSSGDPVLFLSNPPGHRPEDRRRVLDAVKTLNEIQFQDVGDPEIVARIAQYEMAFRMQASVPELMEVRRESASTLQRYGADPAKPSFARNCLLARRLVERGVRLVQLFDSDWDHHADLDNRLTAKCRDIDQPIAALIQDLKERGLLDQTLIVWGAEFGRAPLRQGISGDGTATKAGRDHHKDAFAVWLAGGGVKPGVSWGKTDEFGFDASENPVHVHDLNATVLRLLGLDHTRLTFKHQGRDFRLTDVHGEIIRGILA